jgi:hypothetical protein
LTRRLHAHACEGANENSWQSRPRHAVLSPTLGRLPPPRETAADLARVMLLLDASTIARNVGRILYLQRAVARIPTWAAAPTAFQTHCQRGRPQDFVAGTHVPRSGLPRVFVRALASISMQMLGGRCSCTRSVRSTQPAAAQHSPRVRQPFDLSTTKCKRDASGRVLHHTSPSRTALWRLAAAVLEGDVWCSTRPDLSIRPQPSEQQHAQMQGHARHARRGEHARPGGCGGSRTRVRPGHRPLLTRMHLFPLRLSAAAHIASPIYPRSQGELASRFCLHGGSCPTPPSCTTAACIPHHLCV